MKFELLNHRIYYHRPTSIMEVIYAQLYKFAHDNNEVSLFESSMHAVFPMCEVDNIVWWGTNDACKLHEVLIRIQIDAPKKSELAKFCKKVAPFVIQAREDARADRICAAFADRVNISHTSDAPTSIVHCDAPTSDAQCDAPVSFNDWLSANIVAVREWLANEQSGAEIGVYDIDLYLAAHGLLDLLKQYTVIGGRKSSDATYHAAVGGHLETLQWLFSNGYFDKYSMRMAIKNGHLEIVKWLYHDEEYHEPLMPWRAARHGHLHVLKWFLQQTNIPMGNDLFIGAAHCGNIEIAEYLDSISAKYDPYASSIAAKAGHIEFVRWIIEHGYEISPYALAGALEKKQTIVAQYLIDNGAKIDEKTAKAAIEAGYRLSLVAK